MTNERADGVGQWTHPFRAVLWDIDGTLLLSEPMHFRALRHTLATEGVEVPDEFHHEIVGRTAKVVYEKCRQTFGLSMSFDQWRRLKYSYYTAHAAAITVRPGALEAWRMFEQSGFRQALVSNSDRIVVNANIRVLGLEEPGFISVSINDVVRGKPDPEPYERAAILLGIPAQQCIAIEDSPTGAQAALAAGAHTIAWLEDRSLELPPGIQPVFELEAAVRELLGKIN
ncbi:HAD family hydrolase [Microvirga massiliensis]|uniref:HAD family hydrolase n=1 Tax=Microvirga massiliensis TaxID=1033741 RepID=UPI00062BC83C|nr:HAD family phosphatase [Microvirga massiliensis]